MIHFNIGAVAVVKLFQALDIPLCKYTEEGYRLQDLLSADVVQHKSKYQEEMKSDQRPQKLVHGSSCSEVALQTMFLCLLNLILQINSSLKLITTWGICLKSLYFVNKNCELYISLKKRSAGKGTPQK